MKKVLISGKFLCQTLTGIQRLATEILIRLDELVKNDDYQIMIPQDTDMLINLKNIKKIVLGKNSSLWEIKYPNRYAHKYKMIYVNFTGMDFQIFRNSIICIHDIRPLLKTDGIYFDRLKVRIVFKICFILNVMFSKKIVTDSEFSKKSIERYIKCKADHIKVIGGGWEHIKVIKKDMRIFEKYPEIQCREFYFTLGSALKHKNIEWIKRVAGFNKNYLFVVGGAGYSVKKEENIYYVGRLSDGEIKAFYEKCKAFLFPSLFEGFGIPPLEALACGTPIVLSTKTCLPEIFGNSAHYINPYIYNVDIEKIVHERVENASNVLNKYTWEKAALQWFEIIEELRIQEQIV